MGVSDPRHDLAGTFASEAAKGTPPVAVVGAAMAGVSLEWWAFAMTAIYLALQTAYLIWKWRKEARGG